VPSSAQLLDIINIQTEIAKLGLDLGGVMSLVVERTLSLVDADGAAIELAEGEDMVYRAASGIAKTYLGLRLKRETSLSGLCVQSGTTLRCDDSELDTRVNRAACQKVGLRSMIVMPLMHKGATVGVLKAMSSQPAKFTAEDVKALELLSELVAAAMFFATKYDNDDLFYRATHDSLTGLANRALFMDRLRNEVAQCDRGHQIIGVMMMDMNGLKQVNDTYGHRAGDAVIAEFAHRIQSSARQSDTVARLGGDEFAAILSPVDSSAGIEASLHRFESSIQTPFLFQDNTYQLSASIGVAQCPADSADVHDLLEIADQRMYEVKHEHHARLGRRSPEALA